MLFRSGHAAVYVSEMDCCPDGYASIAPPYGTRKPSIGGANAENRSLDWLWLIEPMAKAADLVAISGLHGDSGLMVLRLTERGRRWLKGELTPCANFGSAYVHFTPTDEATPLLERARDDRLRVAETDITLPSARQTDWDSIWQQQLLPVSHRGSRLNIGKKKRDSFDNEPKVGIFWLDGKRLIIDGTTLAKADIYSEYRNFPTSHLEYWAELQRDGIVPREMEYDERPRGRVIYNAKTQQFTLMADRCILRNKRMVARIMKELSLPKNTEVLPDSHYRCPKCLERKPARKQLEEKDWDIG